MGNGDLATVNVSVENATAISSRAFGKGEEATTLKFAVYDLTGETPTLLDGLFEGEAVKTDADFPGSKAYSLQLATGRTYGFVFWAANPDAPYNVEFNTNGAVMTADYTNALANAETLDAFFAYETITVNGPQTLKVGLKRPFTQINFGTSDMKASEASGYTPSQTKVVVSGVYKQLNLMTKQVEGETTDVTFDYAGIPSEEEFPDVKEGTDYAYLAMAYVLVPEDQILVTTDLYHKNDASEYTLNVANVPVQRNYRTNIFGALLTDELSVEVKTEPDFDGDNNEEVVNVPEGKAVMNGTTYETIEAALAAMKAAEATEATIYVGAGEYTAPKTSDFGVNDNTNTANVVIKGKGDETVFNVDSSRDFGKRNVTLALENMKVVHAYGTGTWSETYGSPWTRINGLTYTNCSVEGPVRLLVNDGATATFEGCKFVNTEGSGFNGYSIIYYAYTGSKVVINNCEFNTNSKAVVMYSESKVKFEMEVNNTNFKTDNTDDKAAIQMHTELGAYGTLKITKSTATGFDTTTEGKGLWSEINNTAAGHPRTYNFDIYVDGELVHTSDKINVDGKSFDTLKDAVDAAENGSTIKLGCGNYNSKTVTWPSNKELTFTGINPKLSHLSNLSYFTAEGSTFHFKDLTIDVEIGGSATSMGFKKIAGATYDNVVFNGQYCLFDGTHTIENSVFNYVPESEATGNYGAGTRYCLYGQPEGKTTVRKCVFNNISSRAFLVYNFGSDQDIKAGDIEMSDCEFNATGDKSKGVIEIHSEKYNGAGTITLTNIQWSQDAYLGLWNEINGRYYTIVVDGKTEQTPAQ